MNASDAAAVRTLASAAWGKATDNQRAMVRFGMTDVALLRGAGIDPYNKADAERARLFTLALMDLAKANGGMVV